MANRIESACGTVEVHAGEALFQSLAARLEGAVVESRNRTIGLTGGSTPKVFYAWAGREKPFSAETIKRARWSTSDERMVPLESEESNFGSADRALLAPLGVPEDNKFPWPVMVDPHSAARSFNMRWRERYGLGAGFDLCLLGMGGDGHIASLFPDSPLLGTPIDELFACVEVPEIGWRLTITPAGLARCGRIVVTVVGAAKAGILREVLEGPPGRYPAQILSEWKERVTWLVDPAAAGELRLV